MLIPSKPENEFLRLQELRSLDILDSCEESLFDDLVKLGSHIAACPISLISLIDADRQWFKAREGLEATQTPRDISFCGHAIHADEAFIVENALEDQRFADNPLVAGDPNIRFYAGFPLVTSKGFRIGTLCTIDRRARTLSAEKVELLSCLARQAAFLIEERKNRRTLEMTRRNSQSLFEKSPFVIASMQGPDHTFEYVNAKNAKVFGSAAVVGKSFLQMQPSAKKTGLIAYLDAVYQDEKTLQLKDSVLAVGDEERHFNLVLTPRFGLDGRVDGVVGIIDDITERKRLELALKNLNDDRDRKFRKIVGLLEQVPVYVALLEGPEHRFLFANRLYRGYFDDGTSFDHTRIVDILPEAVQQGYLTILDRVYRTGVAFVGKEAPFVKTLPNGEHQQLYLNITYEATKNHTGQATGILVAFADVTEEVSARAAIQKKVEELNEERELRERFVLTLSHDLRNPLAAAKIAAERLKRGVLNTAKVHKMSDRICASIDRSEAMVRNLLDANRLKAGQNLPISPKPCQLAAIIEQAVGDVGTVTGRQTQVAERSGALEGAWDPEGVRRIIENLLSNAIKYGDPDTPITVTSMRHGAWVEICVHNMGPVIAAAEQAHLFDTFHRLPSAVEGSQQGWGIGLALVQGIARAHGGSVRVHSDVDHGTTFIVTLPQFTQAPL